MTEIGGLFGAEKGGCPPFMGREMKTPRPVGGGAFAFKGLGIARIRRR